MHEELWEAISQWSGKVSLSQWAHQGGLPQGKEPLFAVVTLLRLQFCTHKNCAVVDVSAHLQPTFLWISSQYLGARAPEPVKKKVLEMVYSWTVRLPDETKIADAYQMLKKQGEPLCKTQNKSNQQDKGLSYV